MSNNKEASTVSKCCGADFHWNSIAEEFYCLKCGRACKVIKSAPEKDCGCVEVGTNGKRPRYCERHLAEHVSTHGPVESDWRKAFDQTKFATGGGLCFEACNYEGMYAELIGFISIIEAQAYARGKHEEIDNLITQIGFVWNTKDDIIKILERRKEKLGNTS